MSLSSLKEKEKWGFSDASGLNSSLNLSCELINLSCTLDDKTPTVRNFLSHADLTVPAHQVQTGCLSGQDAEIWEVRRRRGGWHQRNAVLPSDCFCVCDCLCVMHEQNMQSDQNSSACHGTYSVNGADPDSFSVFFFFVSIAESTGLSLCSLFVWRAWSLAASIILIPLLYRWEDLNNSTFLLSRHHRFLSFCCR